MALATRPFIYCKSASIHGNVSNNRPWIVIYNGDCALNIDIFMFFQLPMDSNS